MWRNAVANAGMAQPVAHRSYRPPVTSSTSSNPPTTTPILGPAVLSLLVHVVKVAPEVGRWRVMERPARGQMLQHQAAELLVLDLVAQHRQQCPADLVAVVPLGCLDERRCVCPRSEALDRGQQRPPAGDRLALLRCEGAD